MKRMVSIIMVLSMMLCFVPIFPYAEEGAINPYEKLEFFKADFKTSGFHEEISADKESGVGGIANQYLVFKNVDFGETGVKSVEVKYASEQISYIHMYAVDAGTDTSAYTCADDGSGIAELNDQKILTESNAGTNSWTAANTKTININNGRMITGKKDLVVAFGEYGNYFSMKFTKGDAYDAYSPIRFVDASYTNAGVNGGPMKTEADGSTVTEDYRGLQDVSQKYAVFKSVALNGISKVNVSRSEEHTSELQSR